jgi:LmbE family N-acetylglucosaminyl deacetylase
MSLIVISPHLDDAVLSVGSALHKRAAAGVDVVVVTVCSITSDPARIAEDHAALASLGVRAVHLELLDAPLRGHEPTWSGLCDGPEDDAFVDVVARRFDVFVTTEVSIAEVWGPLGCGAHVDHRATARAVGHVWPAACLYEDRPYARRRGAIARAWELRGAAIVKQQDAAGDVDDDLHFAAVVGAPLADRSQTTTPTEVLLDHRWLRHALPVDEVARAARRRAIELYASQAPALIGPADAGGWPFDDDAEALWFPS